ncbi:hypothetical protein [Labrenzia sp. 011]|uniref:helix-turn-helix transcriptional regulator n=1 Tax=Labrenzia sp. 011 TaxID=2171494 RepID=UPI0010571C67|nr:hypothetical protein [Labrenzia sp. 011]
MSNGRSALQFLLAEASLFHPYCKTSIDKGCADGTSSPDGGIVHDPDRVEPPTACQEETAQQHRLLSGAPGLVAPLRRTEKSTILFACLFTAHTPDTIDTTVAFETFETMVKALTPGLHGYLRLEQERSLIQVHRTLLSALGTPAILVNFEREILVQTPAALKMLEELGLATGAGRKLQVNNRQIETALQLLVSDHENPPRKTPSVYITGRNGCPKRVSIQTVAPPAYGSGEIVRPFFLIRIAETTPLSEDVESILHDHYDLSLSEAHLARHLTMTGSMNATADHLGITRNTAKTHLRRIYEKTGAHTQLQLARLVHKLASLF